MLLCSGFAKCTWNCPSCLEWNWCTNVAINRWQSSLNLSLHQSPIQGDRKAVSWRWQKTLKFIKNHESRKWLGEEKQTDKKSSGYFLLCRKQPLSVGSQGILRFFSGHLFKPTPCSLLTMNKTLQPPADCWCRNFASLSMSRQGRHCFLLKVKAECRSFQAAGWRRMH